MYGVCDHTTGVRNPKNMAISVRRSAAGALQDLEEYHRGYNQLGEVRSSQVVSKVVKWCPRYLPRNASTSIYRSLFGRSETNLR